MAFVSRLLGVVCSAGSKKGKKHTEHERVQFWGTTEHERGLARTPHGKNTLKTRGVVLGYH